MTDFKFEPTTTSCEFKQLILDTVKTLIESNISGPWDNNTLILVDNYFGVDASGSHQVRHQFSETQS